jgi:short-subunit dehydrogenase
MRVLLITGASSGIGASAARALAAPDTALVLHARKNRDGLDCVAQSVRQAGAQPWCSRATSPNQVWPSAW